MDVHLIVSLAACVFSLLGLISTVLLSNAVFRIMDSGDKDQMSETKEPQKALVDLNNSLTYDPRFRTKN